MELGFVSAVLGDQDLDQVLKIGKDTGYDCVEVMCWPKDRFTGVTHLDVPFLTDADADEVRGKFKSMGLSMSALGYYPNPLSPDPEEAIVASEHMQHVIAAAPKMGLKTINTFIGRDPRASEEENWVRFKNVWEPLVKLAEDSGVRIGIENCPMFFCEHDRPCGRNLATSPAIWRRMFETIESDAFGLNYDPSHLVWLHIDYLKPLQEFASKLFHVHAKDALVLEDKLNDLGILALPPELHDAKLPGLGQVDWAEFLRALSAAGYDGPVCVEVEDRDFEGELPRRIEALRKSSEFLRPLMS